MPDAAHRVPRSAVTLVSLMPCPPMPTNACAHRCSRMDTASIRRRWTTSYLPFIYHFMSKLSGSGKPS